MSASRGSTAWLTRSLPGLRGRWLLTAAAIVAWVLVLSGISVAGARAEFGIASFDQQASERDGSTSTRAGGHPYSLTTSFVLNQEADAHGNPLPQGGPLKDVVADLPAGVVGNPASLVQCRVSEFITDPTSNSSSTCQPEAQVGVVRLSLSFGGGAVDFLPVPVYNLKPPPGVAAEFGFRVFQAVVFLDASVRPGDQGVRVKIRNASQILTVLGSSLTLWGVPADPSHDADRFCHGAFLTDPGCTSNAAEEAFLTNPTSCGTPDSGLETRLQVASWRTPDVFDTASSFAHVAGASERQVAISECDLLPFHPSMALRPETLTPDSPTGLAVDVNFPQDGLTNPAGLATAHLKNAKVTLPDGLTISPSAAAGLEACSDVQLAFGSDAPVTCPEASKIGTVTATTPLLEEVLTGGIYTGTQQGDDPESGKMFRIFLVLENKERGLLVKLRGQVRANHATGQLETLFENNPQLPVSTLSLRFKDGPRAPLATPLSCGPKLVDGDFTSWGGQEAKLTDAFAIDCPPGLGGFSPLAEVGSANARAGAFSPLLTEIDRVDGQQYLGGVTLETPTGLSARLKGVPLCGEAAAAAGACPLASRIGTATVGSGPGLRPFFLSGPVSITGPYKGAPYGLSVAVRALAGPFDLGVVVVRQAIFVDPNDAHLKVVSDPVPSIVKGVPLRLRTIHVNVDRPGFTLNPTSCATKRITTTLTSTQGAVARPTSRFQVGECRSLGLSPKLRLALTGRGQTSDGKHPGLNAVLTQPRGQAGFRRVTVKLPLSLALDPRNAASDSLCEFEEGQKDDPHCPKASIIGRARAVTPLLNHPLSGNVYFMKNVRIDKKTGRRIRTLPTLLVALRGEVALNLRAQTSISADNKLVSTFATIPDAPVSRFELTLKGGKRGILVVTTNRNLCRSRQVAEVGVAGQNGKRTDLSPIMSAPCPRDRRR